MKTALRQNVNEGSPVEFLLRFRDNLSGEVYTPESVKILVAHESGERTVTIPGLGEITYPIWEFSPDSDELQVRLETLGNLHNLMVDRRKNRELRSIFIITKPPDSDADDYITSEISYWVYKLPGLEGLT